MEAGRICFLCQTPPTLAGAGRRVSPPDTQFRRIAALNSDFGSIIPNTRLECWRFNKILTRTLINLDCISLTGFRTIMEQIDNYRTYRSQSTHKC